VTDTTGRPRYEQGTGFLLSRLGALAERSWSVLLARHGLTQTQYSALFVLGESGPLGQGRLAELIAVDPRNVVAVIDGLAGLGLAERLHDPTDGRRRQVLLTSRGTKVCNAVASDARAVQDDFLRNLDEGERSDLNRILSRLYDDQVARDNRA
jgi:DNA-binding MarR family transcriptional regulator